MGVEYFPGEILIPSNTNTLTEIIEIETSEDLSAQNHRKIVQIPYLLAKTFQNMHFIPKAHNAFETNENIM